ARRAHARRADLAAVSAGAAGWARRRGAGRALARAARRARARAARVRLARPPRAPAPRLRATPPPALLRRGAPAPAEPEPRPAAVSGDLLPRRSRGVDPPPPRGARAALRDLRAGRLLWGRDVLSRGRGRAPAAAVSGRDHAAA